MTARKSGTAQLQNLPHAGRDASCHQRACDPQIEDAPIRLWEALRNVPAPHPALIDFDRLGGTRVCGTARGGVGASGPQETLGLARQTGSGMHDYHQGE
jgi:hypothetical protein